MLSFGRQLEAIKIKKVAGGLSWCTCKALPPTVGQHGGHERCSYPHPRTPKHWKPPRQCNYSKNKYTLSMLELFALRGFSLLRRISLWHPFQRKITDFGFRQLANIDINDFMVLQKL
jgi:hypothetical protein